MAQGYRQAKNIAIKCPVEARRGGFPEAVTSCHSLNAGSNEGAMQDRPCRFPPEGMVRAHLAGEEPGLRPDVFSDAEPLADRLRRLRVEDERSALMSALGVPSLEVNAVARIPARKRIANPQRQKLADSEPCPDAEDNHRAVAPAVPAFQQVQRFSQLDRG